MFGRKTKYFKCPVVLPNGKKCGRKFATLRMLVEHGERVHGK